MSFYPRSATVRAATDVVVLEMLRNVLDILQRNKTFRAELDREVPRSGRSRRHLRSVPVLPRCRRNSSTTCATASSWCASPPGEMICRQGDQADAFYLVRIGFVKVTEQHPGGELVLTYLARGGYFGEMGLLGGGVAHGDVHGARPRGSRADRAAKISRDGRAIPGRPRGSSRSRASEPTDEPRSGSGSCARADRRVPRRRA